MKNTEECVNIHLVSGEKDKKKSELSAKGGFYKKNGAYYITYTEHTASGMGDSRVLLKVKENTVTMRRMGEFNTVIAYIPGEETEFDYKTPFGKMKMKLMTTGIENRLSEEGGELRIFYTLLSDEKSENTVSVIIGRRRDNI